MFVKISYQGQLLCGQVDDAILETLQEEKGPMLIKLSKSAMIKFQNSADGKPTPVSIPLAEPGESGDTYVNRSMIETVTPLAENGQTVVQLLNYYQPSRITLAQTLPPRKGRLHTNG
jgi:hypothetical protein